LELARVVVYGDDAAALRRQNRESHRRGRGFVEWLQFRSVLAETRADNTDSCNRDLNGCRRGCCGRTLIAATGGPLLGRRACASREEDAERANDRCADRHTSTTAG